MTPGKWARLGKCGSRLCYIRSYPGCALQIPRILADTDSFLSFFFKYQNIKICKNKKYIFYIRKDYILALRGHLLFSWQIH